MSTVAPEIVNTKARVFRLQYRQGNEIKEKHFNFSGPLQEAILRGRDHCEKMGYRFILVRPFIVDLEHQEKLKNESGDLIE